MPPSQPHSALEFMDRSWTQIEPYFHELAQRSLGDGNLHEWLSDWSHLSKLAYEAYQRLRVATEVNTADQAAEQRYNVFLEEVRPAIQAAEQRLKEKLLASGLQPAGFEIPLRNLQAEADLFR